MSFRNLQPDKIVDTIVMLERRIAERFPNSSLSRIAHDLYDIGQEAARRSARIRRPNVALRIVVALLIGSIFAFFAVIATQLKMNDELFELEHFVTSFEATASAAVLVGAAIVFVITLEMRIKRGRALQAIHELRSLAHIIDMHQLTKDPERITGRGANTASSPERKMTPFELGRYLDYCSELLSLVSKTGAIYVQEFADPVAIEAVDRLAVLTNDLSRNIWQKIMILEAIVGPEPAPAAPPVENVEPR
ncbi:MAG: hypothetical protein JNM18_18440 [Planctomycetaceae bacterium]|nr:hypothetical protein [Planctomycetaceae bacterium]